MLERTQLLNGIIFIAKLLCIWNALEKFINMYLLTIEEGNSSLIEVQGKVTRMEEVKTILERYEKETGGVGKHIKVMAEENPELLRAYMNLRSVILTNDGVLTRKVKELILIGIFAASRFEPGIEIHAKGALRAGATKREIFETISLALLAAGTPSFFAGAKALELKET